MHIYELNTDGYDSRFTEFIKLRTKALYKDMKTIAELICDDIKENILNKRAVPSGRIADNTPATERIKKLSNAPLINSGSLHDSISVQAIQDGFEVYISGERNEMAARFNNTERIQTKIFGRLMKSPVKVPARPFFGIRTVIKKDIAKILDGR